MKKILIGTTALVAVGLVAGQASAAEKIKLGLGGYYQSFFKITDQDDIGATSYRTDSVVQEGEIFFLGETVLDNGTKVGVQVQLEGYTTGDQIDEHYVYFDGSWGRLLIGAENSAAYLMHYAAPSAIVGHGMATPNFFGFTTGDNQTDLTYVNETSDANKLTYFTPRMAGFQLGLSYTPSLAGGTGGSSNSYGNLTDDAAGRQEQIVEVGVNYVNKLGGVDLAVSGGYLKGSLEADAIGADDLQVWSLGMNVGFSGFTLGGSYINDNNGLEGNNDMDRWNVGLTYAFGPYTVGGAYALSTREFANGAGDDELEFYEFGGTYAMGPGVNLSAGVQFVNADSDRASARQEGTSFLIGTGISF
ncbi:porin [uncultured Tistrella sp.]|uniref:porin n=1 Tax=Tistrella mobilis TaxID=171437 RepID=UPI000C095637|nr:porin [uncultured Tistrella sp.]MAM73654.1 porin [Tistrella sp.]